MLDISGGNFGYFGAVGFREIFERICRYLSKIFAESHFVLWGPGLFVLRRRVLRVLACCFCDGLEVDGRENFEFGENFVSLVCAVRLLWRLRGTVVFLSGMK